MKVTIEKGTTYDKLTDEQGVVIDGIRDMINRMQEMIDILEEAIDYNDPRLSDFVPSLPAGYFYNPTVDIKKFYALRKRVENMTDSYDKVVSY